MRKRIGFVSNSSSASFLIAKRDLRAGQIAMITNPPKTFKFSQQVGTDKLNVYVSILENDVAIAGRDDDCGMHWLQDWLVNTCKVNPKKITWGD